jgi:uncharacterized protein (DUF2336 family)
VAAPSSLTELDDLVRKADPRRRAKAVRQLGELFVDGAQAFKSQHVAVFDTVLSALAPATESAARADLASRIAAMTNAPPTLVGMLVRDADVRVAGPILRSSPLVDEPTLVEIARATGQPHLLAISERAVLGVAVTDVLVRRGEREVVRSLAANDGATLSSKSYGRLIKRAETDGMLAIAVGKRQDLSDGLLRDLLAGSVDLVRRRLLEAASPLRKASIAKTMVAISAHAPIEGPSKRDFVQAQHDIVKLHRAGKLNKEALLDFAKTRKYEETIAVLAAISAIPAAAVDKLISGERRDSVLVLGKSLGLDWPTVRALLALRSPEGRLSSATDLDLARANFERLSPSTAQRVTKFWKERPPE